MIGSTYLCSTSFVGSSSIVATFLICVLLPKSFTVTVNSSTLLSPASKPTLIPFAKSASSFPIVSPSSFMLPVTNVVPSGISSFTTTSPGAVPWLFKFILYVISSSAVTSIPLAGSDSFVAVMFGLCTSSVTSFVSLPSTTAIFSIVLSYVSAGKLFTVTWNVNVISPLAGTVTSIPACKSSCVNSVLDSSPTVILSGTNVVPSGIWSDTFIVPSASPLLIAVIVYVIVSPSTT